MGTSSVGTLSMGTSSTGTSSMETGGAVRVIDSHTEGEPTRTVVAGGPDLGAGSLAERAARFDERHGAFRDAVLREPRGHDAVVGALLLEPDDAAADAAVIYFNTAGLLGMCGHATIGLAVTLAHMGRASAGALRFETPAGPVTAALEGGGRVRVQNVPSYRLTKDVALDVPGLGRVVGDVAWGGNWFFLVEGAPAPLTLAHVAELTDAAWRVRRALEAAGVTGADGAAIDHIEFSGPPESAKADARNFVLCPGGAYDRSPCGTGTSAKLACLIADGALAEGAPWVQESVIGSLYEGSAVRAETHGAVSPSIAGRAFVCAEATLLFAPDDPYATGIR